MPDQMKLSQRILVVLLGLLAVGFIGLTDHLTGYEISFSLFYLAPILVVAWFAGREEGLVLSALAAATWFICDATGGAQYSRALIPYWNAFVRLVIFAAITHMLSLIRAANLREREAARTDSLTGARNARNLLEILAHEVERMRRGGGPLSLAYLDLDNFKRVNDERGHATGDSLLRLAVDVFRDNLRTVDRFARVGGDEFVVLMPETAAADARAVLERLREKFQAAMALNDWPVTLSIGVVTAERPPRLVDDLIREADALMYEVKGGGKNSLRSRLL